MTCASCGSAAHVLVGGKCTSCWFDERTERAATVQRHLTLVPDFDDLGEQVA